MIKNLIIFRVLIEIIDIYVTVVVIFGFFDCQQLSIITVWSRLWTMTNCDGFWYEITRKTLDVLAGTKRHDLPGAHMDWSHGRLSLDF